MGTAAVPPLSRAVEGDKRILSLKGLSAYKAMVILLLRPQAWPQHAPGTQSFRSTGLGSPQQRTDSRRVRLFRGSRAWGTAALPMPKEARPPRRRGWGLAAGAIPGGSSEWAGGGGGLATVTLRGWAQASAGERRPGCLPGLQCNGSVAAPVLLAQDV